MKKFETRVRQRKWRKRCTDPSTDGRNVECKSPREGWGDAIHDFPYVARMIYPMKFRIFFTGFNPFGVGEGFWGYSFVRGFHPWLLMFNPFGV
jgi:hypothetical protein